MSKEKDLIIKSDERLIRQLNQEKERVSRRIKKHDEELSQIGKDIAAKKGVIAEIEGEIDGLKLRATATSFSRQSARENKAYISGQIKFATDRLEEYKEGEG